MLKSGARDYHVWRRDEIDQPHAVRQSYRVEAELSGSGTKDTFLPNLRIKIPEGSDQPRTRTRFRAFSHGSPRRCCSVLEFCALVLQHFVYGGDVSPAFYEGFARWAESLSQLRIRMFQVHTRKS